MKNSRTGLHVEPEIKSNSVITTPYSINEYYIDPSKNIIIKNSEVSHVQPKVMEVLTYLCTKAKQVVSSDVLIKACWPNQYISDSPVHKCIAQIRKALVDDPKNPRFIKTVPKKGYIFIAQVKGLHISASISRAPWLKESPYPGLHPYTFSQQEVFFGRDQVITEVNQWFTTINERKTTWLSLTAPAGAGKSSLVHAGILPLLSSYTFIITNQQEICSFFDIALIPKTQKPHLSLLKLLLKSGSLSTKMSVDDYCEILNMEKENINEKSTLFKSLLLPKEDSRRFVLFVDHLEQVFDNYSSIKLTPNDHENFFLLLKILISSKKCLLISAIREQFKTELTHYLPDYLHPFHYPIPPFNHTELIDIIQKPTELAGVGFEYNERSRERLNSEIIQQLQSQYVPINSVQYMLAQLYKKKCNQLITYNAYKELDGIAGTLASIAEKTYQHLTEKEKQCLPSIFFRIITLNPDSEIIINEQHCSLDDFTDKNKISVISQFINTNIFKLTLINEKSYIQLVHYSLLTAWPRMDLWVKENISILYVRHDLRISAQRWLFHDRSNHYLIHSNKKIIDLKHIIQCHDFEVSADEKTLISLSAHKISRHYLIKKSILILFFISFFSLTVLALTLIEKNKKINSIRENSEELISTILHDLKDKLTPLGKLELLNIIAEKTSNYFTLTGTDNLSTKSFIHWIEAQQILGEININKKNYIDAEAYFIKNLTALTQTFELHKSNVRNAEQEKLLELTMITYYWLGYSAYLQLDYKTAQSHWNNYLAHTDKLISDYAKEKWELEKSYAFNNLGALSEKTDDLEKASDYFELSAQIKLSLLTKQPDNVTIRTYLADTRSWQSNIQAKAGKLFLAIENLQQALEQVEKIYILNRSFENIERLAELEHRIASLYYDSGNLIKANYFSERAKDNISKLIINDDENYLFKEDLLKNHLLLIQILINRNLLDQALSYIDQAKKLTSKSTQNSISSKDIVRAKVYLLQYKSRVFSLLNQPLNAKVAIASAQKLFQKHLIIDTDIIIYAQLVITDLNIRLNNKNKILIANEAYKLLAILETHLSSANIDYQILGIYVTTGNFLNNLQLDKHLKLNNSWLRLYQKSEYNIPYYSLINN